MPLRSSFFFFNDTATTEIYTLSLHDALPISRRGRAACWPTSSPLRSGGCPASSAPPSWPARAPVSRSEEHTSELQSQSNLVCRLLLEKKKHSCDSRPGETRKDRSLCLWPSAP